MSFQSPVRDEHHRARRIRIDREAHRAPRSRARSQPGRARANAFRSSVARVNRRKCRIGRCRGLILLRGLTTGAGGSALGGLARKVARLHEGCAGFRFVPAVALASRRQPCSRNERDATGDRHEVRWFGSRAKRRRIHRRASPLHRGAPRACRCRPNPPPHRTLALLRHRAARSAVERRPSRRRRAQACSSARARARSERLPAPRDPLESRAIRPWSPGSLLSEARALRWEPEP